MARKLGLPVAEGDDDVAPTLAKMRERLGGRMTDDAPPGALGPGALVSVSTSAGTARVGVLISRSATTADVYLSKGVVKRTRPESVLLHLGEPTEEQARVVTHSRMFATLREGDAVSVEEREGLSSGAVLREKCRYGALVETGDGRLLAVGFRRLWPAARRESPS